MKATKILFATGLFIAFAFLVALFTAAMLKLETSNNSIKSKSNGNAFGNLSQPVILNMQEISKHNNASDCWVLVNNKVYDLTSFVYSHSGGSGAILPNCGKDGSEAFNTQNGKGSHEPGNINILATFYIGELNQQISNEGLQNKTLGNTNINKKFDNEDEKEDD